MSKDKLSLICAVIGNAYIYHFASNYWGESILVMDKNGLAFARVSWYYNDYQTVYLDFLSVDEKIRRNRVGTILQEKREEIGRILGANSSMLSVEKKSWMHDWYSRRRYIDYKKHEDERLIWMIKDLR